MDKNRIVVHINIKPYLKSFFCSFYPDQQEPLYLPKRDKYNERLAFLMSQPPPNYVEPPVDSTKLSIILPYFDTIDIFNQTFLSERAQIAFTKTIHISFVYHYMDFMHACYAQGFGRYDSIRLFLEKYNIPHYPYIEDMLSKIVFRDKDLHRKYPKRAYSRKNVP